MYLVPNVPLIPQALDKSCWYASAQMLMQWRRETTQSCEMGMPDPSEVPDIVDIYKANDGLSDSQILNLAQELGLQVLPPMSPTAGAIQSMLQNYGPLWTNGATHITVIAGVDVDGEKLYIHNPLPVGVGAVEWRGMDWLGGQDYDSLDPNTNAGVFLYCPLLS